MSEKKFSLARAYGKVAATLGAGGPPAANVPPVNPDTQREEKIAALRAVVRGAGYAKHHKKTRQQLAGNDDTVVSLPFAEDLELALVIDQEATSIIVFESDMARLELTTEDAMALGRAQVLASLPPLPTADHLNAGLLESPSMDYMPSLMHADGWDELDRSLGGELIVAVPSDDKILIARLNTSEKRAEMREYADKLHWNAYRGISASLFVRRHGGWVIASE